MSPVNTQYANTVTALANFNTPDKVRNTSFETLAKAAGVNPDTFLNFATGSIIVGYVRMMMGVNKNNTH